jgi:ABC-type lipoprotein release transport system permease subunit
MSLVGLAFRNLGRNVRRSAITALGLALSTALCVAYYAIADGMNAELVHSLTRYDLGHLEVHARGYGTRRSLALTLPDPEKILAVTRADPAVRAAAPRLYAAALVGASARSTGAELVGIDPSRERGVTELATRVEQGTFLPDAPTPWPAARELTSSEQALDARLTAREADAAESEIAALASLDHAGAGATAPPAPSTRSVPPVATRTDGTNARAPGDGRVPEDPAALARLESALSPRPVHPPPALLGRALARVLGVHVGDALYLSAQGADGSAQGLETRVAGIFETGTEAYDRGRIYLHIADLGRLVHLDGKAHEVAALTSSPDTARPVAARIQRALGSLPVEARSWGELRPDLERLLAVNRASSALLSLIVFFVASLGVVNTMLMAVSERARELGVLKAIGMSGARIFGLIVVETGGLALIGAVFGASLGLLLDGYLVRHGIDLRTITHGVSFGGIGLAPVVHGAIRLDGVLTPIAMLSGICVAAAVYPAYRAASLEPAVGMRET